jgi:hypothetical protein
MFVDPGERGELRHLGDHLLVIDRFQRILHLHLLGHQTDEIGLAQVVWARGGAGGWAGRSDRS